MAKTPIFAALGERFQDTWKLLSDTTAFLSRTDQFDHYESQLRSLRARLASAAPTNDVSQEVRRELAELRKHLRLQGFDLTLAGKNLRFDGFRNDSCLRDGFRRLVLFLAKDDVFWLSGDDNHVALADILEERLRLSGIESVRERHYLWYRRAGDDLTLSGSDSESKDDFERLIRIGDANALLLLGKLRNLR